LLALFISQFEVHFDWQKLMPEPCDPLAWQYFMHLAEQSCAKASVELAAGTIAKTSANPGK
jgi:hypothetical protein